MITEERLKELIEQGATIYNVCWNQVFEEKLMSNHFVGIADDRVSLMQRYNGYEQDLVDYIDNLYETKEEAEWQAEFGNIERVERLVLPTWEEFETTKISVKFFNKNKEYLMYVFVKNKNTNNCRIIIYADDREQDWIVFEQPLTKENYTKACRKAKELFLKEQSND